MEGIQAGTYEGWCQPLAVPVIPKAGEYTMRPGLCWGTNAGTWKRMPYQTFPLITTYVRGALPYIEHEKLLSTTGLIASPQRTATQVRVAGATQTNPLVKGVKHVTTLPRVLTKVIECEDTKYIPKVEVRTVKRTIEVASKTEKRFVPREVPVDTPFIIPRFEDCEVPVVVSNTISPEIEETEQVVEVPVARYIPHLVPINVYVPRAVAIPVALVEETKQDAPASLPKKTLQQLIKELNPHLEEIDKFNSSQSVKFQELLEKSRAAANFVKCPVPEPQSTPILKITEIEPEGEESDRLVKQVCFSTGGYQAAEVESLFTALSVTSTTDTEGVTPPALKGMSAEQTDLDSHDDMLSAATGASDTIRCTSLVSGKDAPAVPSDVAATAEPKNAIEARSDAAPVAVDSK